MFFKLNGVARAALAVGVCGMAGSAFADTIWIDSFKYDSDSNAHTTFSTTITKSDSPSTGPKAVYAGEMVGNLNGGSFETFCVDIFQTFPGWGSANKSTDYSLVLGSTAFGSRATDVNKLFTNWYSSATTEAASTAFQLALWEIVYESGSGYDVGSGTFTAMSPGTATAAIYSDANNMLANLGTLGSVYTQVDVYQSATKQDFTTISTVPEPESYLLALASLGVLFGVRKIRQRAA